jgi:hypothetical protein
MENHIHQIHFLLLEQNRVPVTNPRFRDMIMKRGYFVTHVSMERLKARRRNISPRNFLQSIKGALAPKVAIKGRNSKQVTCAWQ